MRWSLILVVVNEESDLDSRLANMRAVVHELPRTHFDLLKRLVEHLDKWVTVDLSFRDIPANQIM